MYTQQIEKKNMEGRKERVCQKESKAKLIRFQEADGKWHACEQHPSTKQATAMKLPYTVSRWGEHQTHTEGLLQIMEIRALFVL